MNTLTLKIEQDEDAQAPWDHLDPNIFKFWSNTPRHLSDINTNGCSIDAIRGEDGFDLEETAKALGTGWKCYPVYAYIHSGIALSLGRAGQFGDRWDSGLAGIMAINPEVVGAPDADAMAAGCIEEWNQYLSGDVWGYVIEDEDGNDIESLWGMYGREYCEEEGQAALARLQQHEDEEQRAYNNSL